MARKESKVMIADTNVRLEKRDGIGGRKIWEQIGAVVKQSS